MQEVLPADKRAILLWITPDEDLVDETRELCSSAAYEIIAEIRQSRKLADNRSYVGSGKIAELTEIEEAEYIITPSDLTPTQIFNMGKITGKTVTDRITLVLELFRSKAYSPEARLQVELADLKYQLPILREYIHQGTLSDRPGFLAGGEYRVDYYYQMAKKRMTHINEQLSLIRRRRGRTRSLRKRRGAYLISIAGYTNAGKSSLTNRISDLESDDKRIETANRMFTTIATSTRKMRGERDCIITDTVGFIRDLPPWLVEGFMSTLEEVFESDIILLVVDGSEDLEKVIHKTTESLQILNKGNCTGRIILVLNKMDECDNEKMIEDFLENIAEDLSSLIKDSISISAREGRNIEDLVEMIESNLPDLIRVEMVLRNDNHLQELLGRIRKRSIDMNIDYHDVDVIVTCRMEERWARSTKKMVEGIGGKVLTIENPDRNDI